MKYYLSLLILLPLVSIKLAAQTETKIHTEEIMNINYGDNKAVQKFYDKTKYADKVK